jgi:hypothetical protein
MRRVRWIVAAVVAALAGSMLAPPSTGAVTPGFVTVDGWVQTTTGAVIAHVPGYAPSVGVEVCRFETDCTVATADPTTGAFALEVPSGYSYTTRAFAHLQFGPLTRRIAVSGPNIHDSNTLGLPAEVFGIPARPVHGRITDSSDVPVSGGGLYLCPKTPQGWSLGCAGNRLIGSDPFSGGFADWIDGAKAWLALPFANQGAVTAPIFTILPTATPSDAPVDLGTIRLDAFSPRYVQGHVYGPDGVPVPHLPQTDSVWACPDPGTSGSCPGRVTGFVQSDGSYVLLLDPSKRYHLIADSIALGFRSAYRTIEPGTDSVGGIDFTLEFGTLQGTVGRTGFPTPFPANIIGVGACPEGARESGERESCTGLQAQFAATNGTYRLRLSPGVWRVAGFMYVDGVLVIGDVERVAVGVVDATADVHVAMDTDLFTSTTKSWSADPPPSAGVAITDAGQTATITAPVAGGGDVRITAPPGVVLENVVALEPDAFSSTPELAIPWGTVSFTVQAPSVGGSVTLDMYFADALPADAVYLKYDRADGIWKPFSGFQQVDAHNATLTLVDGPGLGDYDGTANGWITDPATIDFGGEIPDYDVPTLSVPTSARNEVKAGRAVPLTWRATIDGAPVDSLASFDSVTVRPCSSDPEEAVVLAGAPASLGDGWFQLDWKSPKQPNTCWTFTLTLADGDEDSIDVRLRR